VLACLLAGERSAKQILAAMGVPGVPDPDNNFCERQLTVLGKGKGRA
jgi:hypothetical protein